VCPQAQPKRAKPGRLTENGVLVRFAGQVFHVWSGFMTTI
jgi:hypothetical protein